jgi:membrane protease subunit HflK
MANESIDLRALQNKMTPLTILKIIAVALAVLVFFTSSYTVDQREQAVILRLGKYNRTMGPGLHLKLPFGIEKNYNVPTGRKLTAEFGFRGQRHGMARGSQKDHTQESHMLSGDLKVMRVTWTIQYQIRDPRAWLFNVQDQVKTIRDVSQSVINQQVGDLAAVDVVNTHRAYIEEQGKKRMNDLYNKYGLGIEVATVKLQNTIREP